MAWSYFGRNYRWNDKVIEKVHQQIEFGTDVVGAVLFENLYSFAAVDGRRQPLSNLYSFAAVDGGPTNICGLN